MKAAFLAFLMIFCIATSAVAVTEDRLPVACDSSKKVLEQLKKKSYQLIIMGEVDDVQTMVFVNPERDMIVAVSIVIDQKSTTCIFVAGAKNATMFDLPKNLRPKEEDL